MIPAPWLRLFSPVEVNQLLSGGEGGGLDADDMRAHAPLQRGLLSGERHGEGVLEGGALDAGRRQSSLGMPSH